MQFLFNELEFHIGSCPQISKILGDAFLEFSTADLNDDSPSGFMFKSYLELDKTGNYDVRIDQLILLSH